MGKQKNIEKLEQIFEGFMVELKTMDDNSSAWLDIKLGDYHINFSFDGKGKELVDIQIFKDVYGIIDQKMIHTEFKKQ